MTPQERKAIEMALEALERIGLWLKARYSGIGLVGVELEAITALRQAIEQAQKQEPVAWMNKHGACMTAVFKEVDATASEYNVPLYTSQRQWVGLTDEDRDNIINQAYDDTLARKGIDTDLEIAKNIEAKLKEKNG